MQKHKVELDGLKNPCSGGGDGGLWYCSIGLFFVQYFGII